MQEKATDGEWDPEGDAEKQIVSQVHQYARY